VQQKPGLQKLYLEKTEVLISLPLPDSFQFKTWHRIILTNQPQGQTTKRVLSWDKEVTRGEALSFLGSEFSYYRRTKGEKQKRCGFVCND
jgi:hypothetical protein